MLFIIFWINKREAVEFTTKGLIVYLNFIFQAFSYFKKISLSAYNLYLRNSNTKILFVKNTGSLYGSS